MQKRWIRMMRALALLAAGLNPALDAVGQAIPYAHYSMAEGLPSSLVYQVLEDQEGFIWMATDQGVVRFDGYEFKHFNTAEGLPLQDIWQLREDGEGRIFLGSYYPGIIYIEGDSVIAIPDTTGEYFRYKPFLKGDEQVYYEVNVKYYYLKNNKIVQSPWSDSLPDGWSYLATDKRGFHYLTRTVPYSRDEGPFPLKLARWKRGLMEPIATPRGAWTTNPPEDSYREGTLLLRSRDSLYRLHLATQRWERLPLPGKSEERETALRPIQMLRRGDSIFYLGHAEEPLRLVHGFPAGDGELNYRFFNDQAGNWWVATSGQGVYLFSPYVWQAQRISPPEMQVQELALGAGGSLFFLGQERGYGPREPFLYRFRDGATERLQQPLPRPSGLYWHQGQLLMANAKVGDDFLYWQPEAAKSAAHYGAYLTEEWNWGQDHLLSRQGPARHIRFPGGKPSLKDWWYDAHRDELYAGFHQGLIQFRPTEGKQAYEFHYFKGKRVDALVGIEDTLYWGNSQGLYRQPVADLRPGGKLRAEPIPDFPYPVSQISRSPRGGLLLGTDGYGLWYWPGWGRSAQGPLAGTKGEVIRALKIDSLGQVWSATRKGIWVHRWEEGDYVFAQHLGRSAGLPSLAVQDLALRGGYVYAATGRGLFRLPRQPLRPTTPPQLTPVRWQWAGENPAGKAFRLPYDYGRLSVHYSALAYTQVANIRYHYRLVGADSSWRQTTSRQREFLNLQPGQYRFELFAQAGQGPPGPVYRQELIVVPPWWQEPLGQLLALGLVLTIFPLSVWIWQRRKRLRFQQRSEMEQRLARLELEALQAQMNPHFIFNSLTAIQHYILEHELDEADRYLVKFSRLMRGFLEASKSRYISLSEEIRLLKLYLELEQLRHPDTFVVAWDLPEPLDPELEIPTLLLQPFLENAINHGLRDAPRAGKLRIAVELQPEDALLITIEDNGIGRTAAAQRATGKEHPSRGLELLRDRLRVLENQTGQPSRITLEDRAPGTRVRIWLGPAGQM